MMRRSPKRLTLCVSLLILNLAFIWGNSAMPATVSGTLSQWVGNILAALLRLAPSAPAEGHHLLRKLAHFSEFTALGIWLTWFWGMLKERPTEYLALPLLGGLLAACCDETIQLFAAGRYSSLVDVWIDTAGVVLGIGLTFVVHYFYEKRRNH